MLLFTVGDIAGFAGAAAVGGELCFTWLSVGSLTSNVGASTLAN